MAYSSSVMILTPKWFIFVARLWIFPLCIVASEQCIVIHYMLYICATFPAMLCVFTFHSWKSGTNSCPFVQNSMWPTNKCSVDVPHASQLELYGYSHLYNSASIEGWLVLSWIVNASSSACKGLYYSTSWLQYSTSPLTWIVIYELTSPEAVTFWHFIARYFLH